MSTASGRDPAACLPEITEEGRILELRRSLPRFYHPSDPTILVQGGARSFKHGGDGWFASDGSLICRLTGFTVNAVGAHIRGAAGKRLTVKGADVLERGVENGGTPPECEDLLHEVALLDPGSAEAGGREPLKGADNTAVQAQAESFVVEQTSWWSTRDPRVDHAELYARSGVSGMLPSPIAVTPPARPWLPRHLDWEVEFFASPRAVASWALDELDFTPVATDMPAADPPEGQRISGRTLLTGGAAAAAAAAARRAIADAAAVGSSTQLDEVKTERSTRRAAPRCCSTR